MPDLKISQLPAASTPLAGTELVPIVQGGTTDQTTVQAILTSAVPSGTANGVLYLNGSKVVTSGSGLTFDGNNLGVGSAAGSNARLFAYANDATLPTLMARQDGAGPMQVWQSAGGAEAMRLTSTGLGIGTSSPSAPLMVLKGAAGSDIAYLLNAGGYGFRFQAQTGGSGTNNLLYVASGETLSLGVNNAEQMRLTNTGLGIGTSSPAYKLDVRGVIAGGNGTIVGGISFSSRAEIGAISNHNLGLITNNVTHAILDTSGNLGLGVTPSAWGTSAFQTKVASVWGFNNNAYVGCNYYFDGTDRRYIATATASEYAQFNGQHTWYTAPSGTAGNAISFSQVMTLDASGNLGVGITNPSVKLHVSGTGDQKIYISTSTSGSPELQLRAEGVNGGAITYDRGNQTLRLSNAGVVSAYASTSGNFVIGTAALATTATDGFLYVPTCAGTPTGTPTTQTGTAPIVVDTTNNKLYFYSGGQWRDAGP